jgi:hypothetical protein
MRKVGMTSIPDGRSVKLPWHTISWARGGDCEPWAEVDIRMELSAYGGTAWLRYDVDHYSQRTGPQEYPVSMVATPCPYGGLRWWWICPTTGRRVQKLYLPNGGTRFLSRGPDAYRLAYASQRHGLVDRMHARNRRLYARLGTDYGGLLNDSWPPKPKRMRWRTYNAICDRLDAASHVLDLELLQVLASLTRLGA